MVLNNKSYCHVKIRYLCDRIEKRTGLTLMTNLSEEFKQLEFKNDYSYIVIDWKKRAIFKMAINTNGVAQDWLEEILSALAWLQIGQDYNEKLQKINLKRRNENGRKKE